MPGTVQPLAQPILQRSAQGHKRKPLLPRPSGRFRFNEPTFVGGAAEVSSAPITAVRRMSGTGGAFIRRRYSDGRIDNLWSPVSITV